MKNKKTLVILATALIGLVLYLITSLTGYLVDTPFNVIPVICTVVGAALIVVGDKVKCSLCKDVLLVAGALALIGALSLFAMDRVRVAADVWFIPVNRPASEDVCLYVSLVGVAMYVVSVITAAVKGFCSKE
jgi:hypothetical protein